MRRIVVTGVAGFIGSHLADRLLASGHTVVGVDHLGPGYDRVEKLNHIHAARFDRSFTLVRTDARDVDAIRNLLLKVQPDTVVHLAGKSGSRYSFQDRPAYREGNVRTTLELLRAVEAAGGAHVIYGSCASVYGTSSDAMSESQEPAPASPYAASKLAAERVALQWGFRTRFPVTALRIFSTYGPRQRPGMAFRQFAARMARGERPVVYGQPRRDWIYVSDVVDGLIAAIRRPSVTGVLNLGTGRSVTIRRALRLLARALDVPEPDPDFRAAAPGSPTRTQAETSRAEAELEWRARTPLRRGLHYFSEWLRFADPAIAACLEPTPFPPRRTDGDERLLARPVAAWFRA